MFCEICFHMFSQFFVFSLDWNFWSSKYMKRDLYDNFFENTELLGKHWKNDLLESTNWRRKKENKEKIGGEFVQSKNSNLTRGFKLFFGKCRLHVSWYFKDEIKKGRVRLTISYVHFCWGQGGTKYAIWRAGIGKISIPAQDP